MNFTTDLTLDLSGDETGTEILRRRHGQPTPVVYSTARKQVAKWEERARANRMAGGLESYTFAVQDPKTKRWAAGVQLCVGHRKFRRIVSLAAFADDDAAMEAARRWLWRLERDR